MRGEPRRVVVFIDGSNLYHALKRSFGNAQIDFQFLCDRLVGPDRDLVRVYYYNALVNQTERPDRYAGQQKFLSDLNRQPYFELRLGRLVRNGEHLEEKGVDVGLAVDMVSYAYEDRYDVAVLISGDSDFCYPVQLVKNRGKHVELAYPNVASLAGQLRATCDVFVELTKEDLQLQRHEGSLVQVGS